MNKIILVGKVSDVRKVSNHYFKGEKIKLQSFLNWHFESKNTFEKVASIIN